MQQLTLKKCKAAARKAFSARRLLAQHPKAESRVCVYERGTYHCGIGAALTKTTLKALKAYDERNSSDVNGGSVEMLLDKGLVGILDPIEKDAIEELQSLHDAWAKASHNSGAKYSFAIAARQAFVEFINAA